MKVLVDTNVVLDVLMRDRPFSDSANEILRLCSEKIVNGYIAANSILDAYYILRKELTSKKRKKALLDVCRFVNIVEIDTDKIQQALNDNSFSDTEDYVQYLCAKEVRADYIITRNIRDFAKSDIPVILPDDFLKLLT